MQAVTQNGPFCVSLRALRHSALHVSTSANYWCDHHLIHPAEDVSVVLLEAPNSGQTSQRSRQLVSVQDAEISQPQRELPPRARPVAEHQAAG